MQTAFLARFMKLVFILWGILAWPVLQGHARDLGVPADTTGHALTDSSWVLGLYRTGTGLHSAALSILPGKEIRTGGISSFPQSLTGKMAGLIIMPMSFQPGKETALLMSRGTHAFGYTNPLVVVDGIPDRDITLLDPADIESIVLLKDGTAAVYGSRGSNGVLFVTTRHGNPGQPVLNIRINQGFSRPARIPGMIDAATYAVMRNEYASYNGMGSYFTADEIQAFKDGSDPLRYPNTDWFNTVYRKASCFGSIHADLQGGTPGFRYYFSAGTRNQGGIYTQSAYRNRLSQVRTNLDGSVGFLQYHVGLSYQQEDGKAPVQSENNVATWIFNAKPVAVAFWPGHQPNGSFEYGENPALMATSYYGSTDLGRNYFHSYATLSADLPFLKGMTVNALFALDFRRKVQETTQEPYILYYWDGLLDPSTGEPVLTSEMRDENLWQYHAQSGYSQNTTGVNLQYIHNIGPLTPTLYAGFERISIENDLSRQTASYDGQVNNTNSTSFSSLDLSLRRLDYYAGIRLNLLNRYVLELNGDHSVSPYLMDPQERRTFFSSSMAWIVSEEKFWKNHLPEFGFLNLHASWCITGNESTELLDYLNFNPDNILNPTPESGTGDMKTSSKLDFGVYGKVGNEVVDFSLDMFHDNRNSRILVNEVITMPRYYKLRNRGLEGMVSFKKTMGEVAIRFSLTGSYARNKMVRMDEIHTFLPGQEMTGKPYSGFGLMFVADGIYANTTEITSSTHIPRAQPGDIRFTDLNGDDAIDAFDRVRIEKDIMPRFQGGFGLSISYRRFDLSAFLQGAAGAVYSINDQGLDDHCNYFDEIAGGRWTPDHTNASYPRATNRDEAYWKSFPNTFWLRSTDYIRLRELEIGYTLSDRVSKALRLKNGRIALQGYNLFTLDKFRLAYPEMPYHRASTNYGQTTPEGITYKQYPAMRSVSVNVTCSF